MNYNTPEERLQDKNKQGKPRPWKEKKAKSMQLARTYSEIEYIRYAERVLSCADYLGFRHDDLASKLILAEAKFCQVRLCPMCGWRKSLKTFAQVSKIMNKVQDNDPNLRPVFLTLTVRNCSGEELAATLQHLTDSWYRLYKHRNFVEQIEGWMRAIEITYNRQDNTYHPHIHAILLVDKQYFSKSNKKYLHTVDWVRLWRVSARLDYDPICDIRKIRQNRENMAKSVAEVAKYAVKDTDYIGFADITKILTYALHLRRLHAFGGVMAATAKELNIKNPEAGDLVNINDEAIREDIATAIIRYGWSFGVGDYIRKR